MDAVAMVSENGAGSGWRVVAAAAAVAGGGCSGLRLCS